MRFKDITKLFNLRRSKYLAYCDKVDQDVRDKKLKSSYDVCDRDPLSRINTGTYRKNRYSYSAFTKFPEKIQFINQITQYLKDEYGSATAGTNWDIGKIFVKPKDRPTLPYFLDISFGWRCYDPEGFDSITLFSRKDNPNGCARNYMRKTFDPKDGDAKSIAKQIIISIKLWMSMAWGEELYPKGVYNNFLLPYQSSVLFDQDGNYKAEELAHYRVNEKINYRANEPIRYTVSAQDAWDLERMDVDQYYAYRRLQKKYKTNLRFKRGDDAIVLCRLYDTGHPHQKGSTYNNYIFERDFDPTDIPMDGDVDEIYDAILSQIIN